MRKTWELQAAIHRMIRTTLVPGMTEAELADRISGLCRNWEGDLVSGARAGGIGGTFSNKVIEPQDSVIVDLQVQADGEWSDVTRTYFVGGITDRQREAYAQVLAALEAGERMLRPGVSCAELYHQMRAAMPSEYRFSHHAGHLIGETPMDPPEFLPDTDASLSEGMTVTLEPGFYVPGQFGIRVENNYRITADGAEALFEFPTALSEFVVGIRESQ